MDKSLSTEDIVNQVNCNVLKYSDIKNYNSIDDMLINDRCVILYETTKNKGHWTCLYKYKNTIYFFDSYGNNHEEQKNFIPNKIKKALKQDHKRLTELLYNSNYDVEYNETQLQQFKNNINTCGRWVVVRMMYPHISVDNFKKLFLNKTKKADEIIYELTKKI